MARKAKTLKLLVSEGEYYGKELSEAVLRMWWQALKEYEPVFVEAALAFHRTDYPAGKWFPSIADIVSLLESDTARLRKPAERAWSAVMAALFRDGHGAGIECRITRKALSDLGGMNYLSHQQTDGLGRLKGTFCDLYAQAALDTQKELAARGRLEKKPEAITALLEDLYSA